MSEDRIAGEDGRKKEDIATSLQDNNDCKVQACVEEVSDVNNDNLKGEEHLLQLKGDNLTCNITEEVKEITEVQRHPTSQKHLSNTSQSSLPRPSKEPETSLDVNKKPSHSSPSKGAAPGKQTENFTETYDVITRKEVQGLTDWNSIHKESLSEIPPIDPGALHDLESRAKDVAHNLDHLLGTLAASLKSLSVIGVQSVDAYRKSIENVEEAVDISIKNMYTLIAKCEELNSHMGPLYTIAAQIKEIKTTLDVFESMCK